MERPLIGFYGDDFTGSTDALAQYHRVGLSGVLLIRPTSEVLARVSTQNDTVVGIAGVSRSLGGDEFASTVRSALQWLQELGPTFIQYKLCSTFDSSSTVGNLAAVVEVAHELFGKFPVPVMPAQPEFGRFTAFGHHFARDGEGVYRLDRHPTMSRHPVTPMEESDLRVVMRRQGPIEVDSLSLEDLRLPPEHVDARLAGHRASGTDAFVIDAISNDDLVRAGGLLWRAAQASTVSFGMGSGGMSFGIGQFLASIGQARSIVRSESIEGVERLLVISGSLAPQTKRQIERAVEQGWARVAIDFDALADSADAGAECERATDAALAAFRSGPGVIVDTLQTASSRRRFEVASSVGGKPDILGSTFARVIRGVLDRLKLERVIICGGDTSGHTVSCLGVEALTMRARLAGSATLCQAWAGNGSPVDGLEVVLKGGQAGELEIFDRVLHGVQP